MTLTCGFQGNPAPTITWEREGSAGLPPVTRMATATESMKSENITLFTVSLVSEPCVQKVLVVLYCNSGTDREGGSRGYVREAKTPSVPPPPSSYTHELLPSCYIWSHPATG